MKLIFALIAVGLLQACAHYESKQYLHNLANDPDCTYRGKPVEYTLPRKCGMEGSGTTVFVRRVSPNYYYISK
jgi:hypothetical protein